MSRKNHHFKEHVDTGVGDRLSRLRRHFVQPMNDVRQGHAALVGLDDDVRAAKFENRNRKNDSGFVRKIVAELKQILGLVD